MDNILQVIKLSCEINGRRLFSPLSFTLRAGEALQIQGANGIGKTTLLKALLGLHTGCSGSINLWADTIYIAHQHWLHPDLTVRQNLQFLQAANVDPGYFGIKPLFDQPTRRLSVGQQQRVSLSRLLNAHAKLWLLDEPFANLDNHARDRLHTLCQQHLAANGSLIVVAHENLNCRSKICLN